MVWAAKIQPLPTPPSLSGNKLDISGTVTSTSSTAGLLQAQKGTVLKPVSSSTFLTGGGGSYTESGLRLYPCCWSARDRIFFVPSCRINPLSDKVPECQKSYTLNQEVYFLCWLCTLLFWKKWILLLSKDALNWSEVTVKIFMMLEKISISNKIFF